MKPVFGSALVAPKAPQLQNILPLVKWLGGKRKLAPEIVRHLPKAVAGTYYEPFAGGAAVFCSLWNRGSIRGPVVLADHNADLIALYEQVRDEPQKLVEALKGHDQRYRSGGTEGASALYYRQREMWNAGLRTPDRFVFLKQTAFNGLWRVNQKGELNSSWGKYTSPLICDEQNVMAWSVALQGSKLFNIDTLKWGLSPKAGDVVYVDPPYIGTFDRYTEVGFTLDQQKLLVQKLASWARQGITVAYSNSMEAEPLVQEFWPEARVFHFETTYNVNRDGAGRTGKRELLAVSQ